MVESLQMFLFLFKSKYRRKSSSHTPFLCSVIILVLLFCNEVFCKCSVECVNGECKNDTCVCFEGWQGPECQYCGGKVRLSAPQGIITDGPSNYSVSVQCTWLIAPDTMDGAGPPPIRIRLESFATECGWDHLYIYDGNSVRAEKLLGVFSGVLQAGESRWTRQVVARSGQALVHFFSDDAYAMEGFNVTYAVNACPSDTAATNCSNHGSCNNGYCTCAPGWQGIACDEPMCPDNCNSAGTCTPSGCECNTNRTGPSCARDVNQAGWAWLWREEGEGTPKTRPPAGLPPPVAGHVLLNVAGNVISVGGESFGDRQFLYKYKVNENKWQAVEIVNDTPSPTPRYLHSAVAYGHEIIVYGGLVLNDHPERGAGLAGLEGRASSVTNELWRLRLDVPNAQWLNATPTDCSLHRPAPINHCGGLQVSGHTAVLAHIGVTRKPIMLVFFGHSPHYGYLHIVQEYYIDENVWSVATSTGWVARGGFGHTAVFDPVSRRVYVHGGLLSESEATQAPSAALHEYDVERRIWRPLPPSSIPRYLHTATFVSPGVLLVFGGNAHNDSAAAVGGGNAARCYSGGALLYHTRCKLWLGAPPAPEAARAAHAALLLPGRRPAQVIIYGGFDGRLRSDALVMSPGAACGTFLTESTCLAAVSTAARACVWRTKENSCVELDEIGWEESFDSNVKACLNEPEIDEEWCSTAGAGGCAACTAAGCAWCGACFRDVAYCPRHRHQVMLSVWECGLGGEAAATCPRLHACAACLAHSAPRQRAHPPHSHPHHHHYQSSEETSTHACYWDYDTIKCRPANTSDDIRLSVSGGALVSGGVAHGGAGGAGAGPLAGCAAPCATLRSCANCTAEECIWCASTATCLDKNAYGATFPLGGCRAWATTGAAHCLPALPHPAGTQHGHEEGVAGAGGGGAGTDGCLVHSSCSACLGEPACGWCADGAGGGAGRCTAGAGGGPHGTGAVCPPARWHFTSCPACQCNGHSVCDAAARCMQPCGARAAGPTCGACAPGHWGNPANGRHCLPCECNGLATSCAAESGRCHCAAKGLAGDRCDKCDAANHYHPDPYNKGACYYDLAVDYQFTFNLSKKEDRHLSAINFRNSPVKADVDADFSITCSAHARMNLTVRARNEPPERVLFTDVNCTNFRYKFAKSEHAFGIEDNVTLTTFFVYVYDFKPPLWIQISFSQYPKLNLQQFFITFSSCFLLLLLVAAALWKVKQKYDMYRRRQRLFVEMEQMASRPFSQVLVELERNPAEVVGGLAPAPVALEPCVGGRAAVLSLVVRLPTGGTGIAPPLGGLALASALVTLGAAHHQPPHHAPQHKHHTHRNTKTIM